MERMDLVSLEATRLAGQVQLETFLTPIFRRIGLCCTSGDTIHALFSRPEVSTTTPARHFIQIRLPMYVHPSDVRTFLQRFEIKSTLFSLEIRSRLTETVLRAFFFFAVEAFGGISSMALDSTTSSYHPPSGSRAKNGSSGKDQERVVDHESVSVWAIRVAGSERREVDSSLA